MPSRPTISQIAKAAGVSTTVVSAVINGKENQTVFVGSEKKARIQAVIREMDYMPSKSARSLRSQKTDVIGAIFNSLNPFFAELLEGLQQECLRLGLEVVPYLTNCDPHREEEYLRLMADGRVDGVLICAKTGATDELIRKYSTAPFRLKIVTTTPPQPGVASVHTDELSAGRLVADHLISQGRRKLGFFGGATDSGRAVGFLQTAREHGFESRTHFGSRFIGSFQIAQQEAAALFDTHPQLDGVFCNNDELAAALMGVAIDRGMCVPDDLAVVGYDNSRVCFYTRPALSSIDTGAAMLTQAAVAKLMNLINKRDYQLHTLIKPRLEVRASSAVAGRSV